MGHLQHHVTTWIHLDLKQALLGINRAANSFLLEQALRQGPHLAQL